MSHPKTFIESLLSETEIQINGTRPWDLQIHDERVYARILAQGSLGFGESYMDGWWSCESLDQLLTQIFRANLEKRIHPLRAIIPALSARLFNPQRTTKAFEIGEKHYDIGNDLYEHMLDKRMVYTCGYWKDATTLDEAQEAKLDLVCKKIGLKSGMRVLDIGCGWGSFAKFAAEKYGAQVTGVTVSKEQVALANERCKGLSVEIRLQDYREITGTFDRIISLGMFEHVGVKNYRTYMEVANRVLADDGLFLLHTIGGNASVHATDPWIDRYIFPNSMLPSAAQIATSAEGLFVMEDWHNFGPDYDKTLMAWYANFVKSWPQLKDQYSERFYRMWQFYLLSSAATFRTRKNQLWQVVFSKPGMVDKYHSLR